MSNTQTRILSAIVLIIIVGACLWHGTLASLILVGFASLLVIDEISVNFFRHKRLSYYYFLSQLVFLAPFIFFNFIESTPGYFSIFINAGLVLNFILILFLVSGSLEIKRVTRLLTKFPAISGGLVLLPIMSLSSLLFSPQWRALLAVLLVVNFGMDTGAWFFGRKFGRHKLWPAVSPNKTIEGLIGGIFTSCILGTFTWWILFGTAKWENLFIFALLGLLSQIGDLIQSKMKRFFAIKDSSSLIPGHGGVYDRLDSLLFLAPFFATALAFLY